VGEVIELIADMDAESKVLAIEARDGYADGSLNWLQAWEMMCRAYRLHRRVKAELARLEAAV